MTSREDSTVRTGFEPLDARHGGLPRERGHLLFGEIGTGKSSFALRFLNEGLSAKERGVLITRSHPEVVFGQARSLGFDFEDAVRRDRLVLVEYADNVLDHVSRVRNDGEIIAELIEQLGSQAVGRVVFDPVTPLLVGSSESAVAFRARSLVQRCSEMRATVVFTLDLPEASGLVTGFRDAAHAVLRMERDKGGRALVPERLPGSAGAVERMSFGPGGQEGEDGAAGRSADPLGRRRVLIIDPDRAQRARIRSLLSDHYIVDVAEDSAMGLVEMATHSPDLAVIEKDAGLDGVELCRRLRARGHNLPIILLSGTIRRQRDRIAALAAGADECLEAPVDGRLLKVKVENLLRRYDGERDRLGPIRAETVVVDAGYAVTQTRDVDYFMGRLGEAVETSSHDGVPFAVAFVRSTWMKPLPHLGPLLREYDLVCEVDGGAAVLLAETSEPGVLAFAKRLKSAADGPLELEYRCFDRPEAEDVMKFATRRLEAGALVERTGSDAS